MRSRLLLPVLAAGTAVALAVAPDAATIVDRSVDLRVDGPALVETVRLEVRLDEPGDLTAWSEYGVGFDDHIRVERIEARVLAASGVEVDKVPRRRFREVTSTGFGLHTSASTTVVPFPALDVGQRLAIQVVRRIEPLFPGWQVLLDAGDPQERVEVRVRGGGDHLRWELRDPAEQFAVERRDDARVVVVGRDVPRRESPAYAGDADWVRPSLRLAWGPDATWSDVAAWYHDLVAGLPRGDGAVRALAERHTAGVESPRERLEALAHHVQRTIRYEAVAIGPGGWIPTPAHDTLARGWGDCKDMSELLAELLRAAGLPAHLALVRTGFGGAVDPSFPATLGFNHCVVAVPASALDVRPGDTVADGFVILDPTVDRGGAAWLSPYLQDQWALVVDGADGPLVRIPARADAEGRGLVVSGTVDRDGTLSGRAVMRLFGVRALGWLRDMGSAPPDRIEESIRFWIGEVLPAARLSRVEWKKLEGEVPAVELAAVLTVPSLVHGSAERLRLRVAGLSPLPQGRVLDGRAEPVVLWPGRHRALWQLHLPTGWRPIREEHTEVRNAAGSSVRSIRTGPDGEAVVDLDVVVLRPRYGPDSFEVLRELGVAASRAERRSVRLECEE